MWNIFVISHPTKKLRMPPPQTKFLNTSPVCRGSPVCFSPCFLAYNVFLVIIGLNEKYTILVSDVQISLFSIPLPTQSHTHHLPIFFLVCLISFKLTVIELSLRNKKNAFMYMSWYMNSEHA